MDNKEIYQLLTIIESVHPSFNIASTKDQFKIAAWTSLIGDLDFEICKLAIFKILNESPYPPKPADIRRAIDEINNPDAHMLTQGDGWNEVMEAIRRFGYAREQEALESMSPLTQLAVKAMGWKAICMNTNEMAERAHFNKYFDTYKDRARKEALMPPNVKLQIDMNKAKATVGIKGAVLGAVKQLSTRELD